MKNLNQRLRELLIGQQCINFRFVEGGTLIIYLSPKTQNGKAQRRLWIDCAWRMRNKDAITVGSIDDPSDVLESMQRLVGLFVESLSIDVRSGDLRLGFSGEIYIETFGYCNVMEHWEFRQSDGLRLGVGPEYAAFESFAEPDSAESSWA